MPNNNINDHITDQEIAFAHLVLSGTMTDRRAAEAVGLNPDTKAEPRVHAYMHEHRAAVHERLVQQETEELPRFNLSRNRVLARLWEIADLAPEMTRGSASAQVKALSMIVAIEGLIPDRRVLSAKNKPAPPLVYPPFYVSEWMRTQQDGKSVDPEPPAAQEEAVVEPQSAPYPDPTPKEELSSSRPVVEGPELRRSVVEGPAVPAPLNPSQTASPLPRVPMADYVAPDTRRPFSIDKNRFGRRR